jgi:hypothetical protein
VSFDYISRVDFGGEKGEFGPVTLTLLDGTLLKENLGWKGRSDTKLSGPVKLGTFEMGLAGIKTIEIRRVSAPSSVPQTPPSGYHMATVVLANGKSTRVSDFEFRSRCASGGWCCYGEDLDNVPYLEGVKVSFSKVKEIEFLHDQKQDQGLPMKVTLLEGEPITYATQPPSPCQHTDWRLTGRAALGFFDIKVNTVKKVVFTVSQ